MRSHKEEMGAAAEKEADASGPPVVTDGGARTRSDPATLLFAAAIFVSAALVFAVQPMFAKMVLPLLGGAPAVWNTCLVFYQAALLGGYLYAHLSLKWLGPRRQAALHLALMCLPWLVLPLGVAQGWIPPQEAFPVPWLWMLLSASVGLPFLVASASAPMLQAWLAQTKGRSARDPYFLYAASNLGSLLALLAYPLLIESHLTLAGQSRWWAGGYGLLMALVAGCAVWLWRSSPAGPAAPRSAAEVQPVHEADRPSLWRRLRWLALSLVPSSLLLGVTTHLSTDVAAMPLLWIVPLALYLLTFVLVFARRTIIPLPWMVRAQPYLIVAAAGSLLWNAGSPPAIVLLGSLHLLAFFATAMVCHGQLAADRPASHRLTEFYLWLSLGGVLGGLLSALAAPLVFSSVLEYPLMLAAACALRPRVTAPGPRALLRKLAAPVAILLLCGAVAWGMRSEGFLAGWRYTDIPATKLAVVGLAAVAAFLLRRRPLPFALGAAALAAVSMWCAETEMRLLHMERSFFGVLRVEYDPVWNIHGFRHGSTRHGVQSLNASDRPDPWGYHHREGPLGQVFRTLQSRRPLREIGVLGLGAGAVAAYGQPGERITFYEIDPAVERIARNPEYFTYLSDCRAGMDVIIGDARLSLVHGPPRRFDLLIVDAFSSDSLPVHLITREALRIYLQHLAERGLLAVHISSRYLNLAPVLGVLAADAGLVARIRVDSRDSSVLGKQSTRWVVMARRTEDLGPLAEDPRWTPLLPGGGRLWTDDFSDVVAAVQWDFPWESLRPSTWWSEQRVEAHCSLGNALADRGRIEEAIAHYQKALEINPDYADAHNNLGSVLAGCRRIDEAIAHYRKALEIKPDFELAHYNLANALAGQGRLSEAIAHYQKALKIKPDYADAHNNLGSILLTGRGRVDEAIAHFQKAVEIRPHLAEAHVNLGNALIGRGQIDEAIIHYQEALNIKPGLAEIHAILGNALAVRKRIDEAIAHYRKALELKPNAPETHNNFGVILFQKGRVDEAIAHFQKALEIRPNYTSARLNLEDARGKQK